jgi:hypothetical protein
MVDMAVDVKEDLPAVPPLVVQGGQFTDGNQIGMCEEKQGVVIGQTAAGMDFCGYLLKNHG